MKDIKKRLIEAAVRKGICAEGLREMESRDADGLLDYYVSNPDWCMERGFPDLDFLRECFGDEELSAHGIFVDRHFRGEVLDGKQAYIFHHCRGRIRSGLNVGKGLIPMLYIGNGCRLSIRGKREEKGCGASVVPVYVFGRNEVSLHENHGVRFRRYDSVAGEERDI